MAELRALTHNHTNAANLGQLTDAALSAAVGISKGGTGETDKTAAFDALSPLAAEGDVLYGGTDGTGTRLAGNATLTRQFLRSVGSGGLATAPAWDGLQAADIPDLSATYDAAGAAATVQGNLTTHIGLTGSNVHGLGTAATHAATDFQAAGSYQPLNSILTSLGGLTLAAGDLLLAAGGTTLANVAKGAANKLLGMTNDAATPFLEYKGVTVTAAGAVGGVTTLNMSQQLTNTYDSGAPFVITNPTVCTNLNADKVDGRDETEFALLAGRSGGQTLVGGTAASEGLTLRSTSHATKGNINFGAHSMMREGATASDNDLWSINYSLAYPLGIRDVSGTGTTFASNVIAFLQSKESGKAGTLLFSDTANTTGSITFIGAGSNASRLGFGCGAETLTVKEGGKVGIGITAPTSPLHVQSSLADAAIGTLLTLDSEHPDATSINFGGGILFRGRTVGNVNAQQALIAAVQEAASNNVHGLWFYTTNSLNNLVKGMTLSNAGDVWVLGNCSALSFTDRTPHFDGDALMELSAVKATEDGEIDHSSLPKFAQTTTVDASGMEVPGRDVSAMVSVLTRAVQQITSRLTALEQLGGIGHTH